ncbi:MAG: hypothetical protein P4L03_01705 [Terracidiphilus sp.]|nr:hypothetical protein [Terracidiphilus sp.]
MCCAMWMLAVTAGAAQSPNATPGAIGAGATPAAAGGGGFTNAAAMQGTGIPAVPAPVTGFNFTLSNNAQHNSLTGWSDVVTPDLSYRFNKHFSLNTNVPWYPRVQNFVAKTVSGVTTYPLQEGTNLLGDTALSGHAQANLGDFGYSLTATGAFPTGEVKYGLSANTKTYNVTNHLEYSIGPFTPDIEAGEGNSSSLAGRSVKKSYTAVGPIANFQAGTSIDLPKKLGLDLEAYENMPIGNQNVYGTVSKKNKKGVIVTKQVLQGTGVAEDNGFQAELDIPLNANLTLSGNYERSLRQGTDTAGITLTWVLRAPKKQVTH